MAEEALIEYLSTDQFNKASANATRLVAKLKLSVQKRELYETHQILRTVYFRFINVKTKVIALEGLLYHGSCYLLELQETLSGQDIATLYLEAAAKCLQNRRDEGGQEASVDLSIPSLVHHGGNRTLDWQVSEKVAHLASSLPNSDIGKPKFIADALKILNHKLLNSSLLHHVLANKFFHQKDYASSRYHYLHCASLENAQEVAQLLVQYQTWGASRSELDLFITQFILQFLCLQSPIDSPKLQNQKNNPATPQQASVSSHKTRSAIKYIAEKIFSNYTMQHPLLDRICVPFSSLPLLNFTYFIISILDVDREASTFKMLYDIYKVTWSRDPNYKGYLDRIGTIYFGIVDQSKQRQGGFLNNILLSLLEGAADDDDDDDDDDDANSNHEANNLSSSDELD